MIALRQSVHQLPLKERVIYLKKLKSALSQISLAKSPENKKKQTDILLHNQEVEHALQELHALQSDTRLLNLEELHALYAFLAIGEGIVVLKEYEESTDRFNQLRRLLHQLISLENLYKHAEGLIGYHLCALEKLEEKGKKSSSDCFHTPPRIDIRIKTALTRRATLTALEQMHKMAECYVVGGAAERLQCVDSQTNTPLPAALFPFGGLSSLLAWLVRDLVAREALAIAVTGQHFVTPIILMTSEESHETIRAFCKKQNWFERPQESFLFISQPLAPVLTERGEWVMTGPLQIDLKPSGHGALWIQLQQAGLLHSLQTMGIRKLLIRQINNPFCGLDDGILAFVGLGLLYDKAFGFASCERKLGAPEGMNVLREHHEEAGMTYCITNIEYGQYPEQGIEENLSNDNAGVLFPANTNILFADLIAIQKTLAINPLPGLLLNMKSKIERKDAKGQPQMLQAGRLESTMQNLADAITDTVTRPSQNLEWDSLSTYLTYNARYKTLSVVKNAYKEGEDPTGTPPACFYDLQSALRELLVDVCGVKMSPLPPLDAYLTTPVPFWLQISPRLGPLYSLIQAKLKRGFLEEGAHLALEIIHLKFHHVALQGSLQIYAEGNGGCFFDHVKVSNKGIEQVLGKDAWKGECNLQESCVIRIDGDGVLHATNVLLEGNIQIHVPAGKLVTAYQDEKGKLHFKTESVSNACMAAYVMTKEGNLSWEIS